MRILVTSGTGTVGSETVRQLGQQSVPVAVLTHSPEKVNSLSAGVEGVVGNLRAADSLTTAMRGVDRLFLITPLSETEAEEGINAVRAAKRAGVKRVVFLSVHDIEKAPHVPHFRSKIEIQNVLRESGLPHTILMPNNFYQNDYWYKDVILEYGIYPQPIGDLGLSRVDVRDIAEAAIHALLEEGHEGQRYPLVGPQALTGQETAEIWSRHLGRPVRYGGNDLDGWVEQARKVLPGWMADDFKIMYAFFQKSGLRASDGDLKQQQKILHHPPRDFDSFVGETARAWKSLAAA